MKRYLIKVTYLEGRHAGETYLLRKGGYVTEPGYIEWEDTTYASYKTALWQCRRLESDNELNMRIERKDRAYARQMGRKFREYNIYELQSYEPYEVEI